MIRVVLKLFDWFAWLLRWCGCDYQQFRTILEVKLTLDGRRAPSALGATAAAERKTRNVMLSTSVTYVVFGIFMAVSVAIIDSVLVSMTLIHAMIMVMTAMTLVADFSSVLLDTTDNAVILPRPVDGRTIVVVRVAHICVYLSTIILSLSLATLVIGSVLVHPLFAPLFLVTLAGTACLTVCLVSVFYLLAARVMNVERFKDVVLYCQILMTIAVFGGYQVLPRLMAIDTAAAAASIVDKWWVYLVPPAWMAAPLDLLSGSRQIPLFLLTLLGVVAPVASLHLLVFKLAPRFRESLAGLGTDTGTRLRPGAQATGRRSWADSLARITSRDSVQRASFVLTWQLCSRDRKFKLRTYPSLAIVIIMLAGVMMNSARAATLDEAFGTLRETFSHLFILYFGCMLIASCVIHLRYSDDYAAAWLYQALPVPLPGAVFMGALKAIVVRYVLIVSGLMNGLVLAVWGLGVWLDVVLASVMTLLVCVIFGLLLGREFPFSRQVVVREQSGRMIWNFLVMLLVAALGGIHYLLSGFPVALAIMVPIVLMLTRILGGIYARISWGAYARVAE